MARTKKTAKRRRNSFVHDIHHYNDPDKPHIDVDSTAITATTANTAIPPARSALENLGNDVLKCVFDFLRHSSDLRACCLANRHLRTHALPRLYHRIHLNLDNLIINDSFCRQIGLIDPRNPGLRHVKEVVVRPNEYMDYSSVATWLLKLIEALPRGQLRDFKVLSPQMNAKISALLWQMQPNLRNIQILGQGSLSDDQLDLTPMVSDEYSTIFKQITSIELAPNDWSSATAAGMALQKGHVNSLAVNGVGCEENGDFEDPFDGSVLGSLTGCLFGHIDTSIPKAQRLDSIVLTSLHLHNIKLHKIWLACLDVTNLKELVLQYCSHIDVFVNDLLSASNAPPSIESLTIVHMLAETQDQTMERIDDLLAKMEGSLRRLELCLREAKRLPDPSTINRHRASLRHLILDITASSGPLLWSTDELSTMLNNCKNLSQLGLHTGKPSFQWGFELTEYELSKRDGHGKFLNTWKVIFDHVNLTTLNLLSWPQQFKPNESASFYLPLQQKLQHFAWELLRWARYTHHRPELHTRRLEILAFGGREYKMTPYPRYIIEGEVTAMQRTRKTALQIGLKELVAEGLAVSILHHDWRVWDWEKRRTPIATPFYVFDELTAGH